MVGVNKSSCSDDQLSNLEEEQLYPEKEEQRCCELQQSLKASIPKRLPKPSRSECEEQICVADYEASSYLPQYQNYQELLSKQTQPQEITTLEDATDEYTTSDYYDSMKAIDKEHHHTTGTGFIKIGGPDEEAEGFHYLSHPSDIPHAPKSGISNPAMNDWVPQSEIRVPPSTKPSRSESNVDF